MPLMEAMIQRANAMFSRRNINRVPYRKLRDLPPGATFAQGAVALKIAETPQEQAYLNGWPHSMMMAVTMIIRSALSREGRLPITFAWAPGYDYELTVWESRAVRGSSAGITILFKSRYPGDELAGGRQAAQPAAKQATPAQAASKKTPAKTASKKRAARR